MMMKHRPIISAAIFSMLACALPMTAIAEFNLDKLKALVEKVKQGQSNQDQTSAPTSSSPSVGQTGNESDKPATPGVNGTEVSPEFGLQKIVLLKKADARLQAALSRTPAAGLAKEGSSLAMVDLDDDDKPELIVQGSGQACASTGCNTIVMRKNGADWLVLLETVIPRAELVGITNEKSGAFRHLASLDENKLILTTDAPGGASEKRPMVYAVGAQARSYPSTPNVESAPASGSSEGVRASSASGSTSRDVAGIKIGMGVADAKKALQAKSRSSAHLPINFDSYGRKWTGMYLSIPAEVAKIDNRFNKKSDEVVVVDFSSPPAAQKVLAVQRYKRYPKDKTPSLAATESGLLEKYGQWDTVKTDRGANYYYWGRSAKTGATCIPVKLVDPGYRLDDFIQAETSRAVICQGYGTWGQCIKPVRDYLDFNGSLSGCGVQIAAYVLYLNKETKETSPVSEIGTFIADLSGAAASENAFSEMARQHEKNKNLNSIKSGGKPDL
jgi:hypothetical protein